VIGDIPARIRIAGVIRATDEVGQMLNESRLHIHNGHLRAAGCVAAVELERRMKALVPRPLTVKRRDPSLEDYNQAAFDENIIDQETWTLVKNLAAIRKRCVHSLDRDPTNPEIADLIDCVDRMLRTYSAP
jgi:hypothetical protein